MIRKAYSAGAVKVASWFQEFRTFIELLSEGKTYAKIKELNEQDNIFGASTVTRKRQVYSTVSARARAMDESFVPLFMRVNAVAQKQLALAAVMAQDTLFHEFDELVLRISRLSDEKSKRILLSKAADVYGRGGKTRITVLTGTTFPHSLRVKWTLRTNPLSPAAEYEKKAVDASPQRRYIQV